MKTDHALTLTERTMLGLLFIQRYRFLTIEQFARAADLHPKTAANQLLNFEQHGLLGHFGNTGLGGGRKTVKVYFLTRKGWELLVRESEIPPELIGAHKEIKVEARWSPQMYHRLRTVDLMIAAECALRKRPHLAIVKTFLEYRRVKRGNHVTCETTDFVDTEEIAENKIIPDAAFILENTQTKRRALFFLEMDMATERIITTFVRNHQLTVHHKFTQYDRYLKSFRYTETYREYGEFRSFIVLFVTLNENRVENVRRELQDLTHELAVYYRFTTFDAAMGNFLGAIWKSRALSDTSVYPLVRD
jgi:hypothetical protein